MPWMNLTLGESRRSPVCLATMLDTFTTTTAFHHGSTLNCQTCNIPVPAKFVLSAGDCTLAYWTRLTLCPCRRAAANASDKEPEPDAPPGASQRVSLGRAQVAGSCNSQGGWKQECWRPLALPCQAGVDLVEAGQPASRRGAARAVQPLPPAGHLQDMHASFQIRWEDLVGTMLMASS